MPSTRRSFLGALAAIPAAAPVTARSASRKSPLPPGMVWSRTYGSDSPEHLFLWDVLALEDGYLLVGTSGGRPDIGGDGVIVRTDADGREEWRRRLQLDDPVTLGHVASTEDGGFLVGGVRGDTGGASGLVVNVDADGTEQWRTHLPGSFGPYEPVRITELEDGTVGLAATLTSLEHRWVWAGTYDPETDDLRWTFEQDESGPFRIVEGIAPAADGGFHVGGRDGSANGWLWTFTGAGEHPGAQTVDTPSAPSALARTSDGGFVFAGSGVADGDAAHARAAAGAVATGSVGDRGAPWVLRLDSDLDERRRDTYATPSGYESFATDAVAVVDDGGIVVAGDTSGRDDRGAAVVFRLAPDGSLAWKTPYPRLRDDVVTSVVPGVDGGYVLAGETRPGAYRNSSPSGGPGGWLTKVVQATAQPQSPSPPPSPSPSPTPTRTATESSTRTATESPTGTPSPRGTTAPGFGAGVATLGALLGCLGARLRRASDEE